MIRSFKRRISHRIASDFDYRVRSRPFAGLQLEKAPRWGTGESAAQCLDLYEQEIQNLLLEIQRDRPKSVLIDVGGAGGYFALGSIKSGMFRRCVVVEANEALRAGLDELAALNGVRHEIEIRGFATQCEIADAIAECGGDCVILCDIEGGEYEVFEGVHLSELRKMDVIIELNEFDDAMKSRCSSFIENGIGCLFLAEERSSRVALSLYNLK